MDSTITIEIEGLEELQNSLQNYPSIAGPLVQKAILAGSAALAKYTTRGNVPWRTGNLTQSFRLDTSDNFARWYPTAVYAQAVYYGMDPQPGRFVPAIGKRLTDSSRKGFGMWPGFKGQPYLDTIAEQANPEIQGYFQDALQKIVETIANN